MAWAWLTHLKFVLVFSFFVFVYDWCGSVNMSIVIVGEDLGQAQATFDSRIMLMIGAVL